MAITSYPRVTLQGTGPTQNPQNGQGLMVLNPATNKYEAATAATFSGGGGGGDATAANQSTQITEAQTLNGLITTLNTLITTLNTYNNAFGTGSAEYLNDIKNNTNNVSSNIADIRNFLSAGTGRIQICDSSGNSVSVTANKLNVDTA